MLRAPRLWLPAYPAPRPPRSVGYPLPRRQPRSGSGRRPGSGPAAMAGKGPASPEQLFHPGSDSDSDPPAPGARSPPPPGPGAALGAGLARARGWLGRCGGVRPWPRLLDPRRFAKPRDAAELGRRVTRNAQRFHGNYACVAAALALYCLITSPLLVVALAVFLGACYVLHVRAQQGPLVVLGRELSAGQQYAVAGGVSFPLFWVAGAGSAVFWVLGATLVVIGSHAAFYETEPAEGEELQMEPV
ncbi:prenylated Rab acceptor protein 1 [Alligator mississippiensis]|uniref:prenylated Rab acceptor protein 1 n=1 Tax=Alligator mississippiensis TaxID=8496 RepID=UPI002877C714|nr:prenylated Rab acceptor protein 1 [Alligator mississippiensis]